MILVDTSVWVAHLQRGNQQLAHLLGQGLVMTHPHVVGELALANLKQRGPVLQALQNLTVARIASDTEVLAFIGARDLHGTGIGYVDAHLLAAVHLTPGSSLWTLDKGLHDAASRLSVAADALH